MKEGKHVVLYNPLHSGLHFCITVLTSYSVSAKLFKKEGRIIRERSVSLSAFVYATSSTVRAS